MATLKDVISLYWTLSTTKAGELVQGGDAINQCISVIFNTRPGSDPLRPLFGCELWKFVDRPLNVAIPGVIKAMSDALELWEPRIILTNISFRIDPENIARVIFSISYDLLVRNDVPKIKYSVNSPQKPSSNFGFDYALDFQL